MGSGVLAFRARPAADMVQPDRISCALPEHVLARDDTARSGSVDLMHSVGSGDNRGRPRNLRIVVRRARKPVDPRVEEPILSLRVAGGGARPHSGSRSPDL